MSATSCEALKLIKILGLSYDSIHGCANGCVLFQDTLSHLQVCPKCGTDRFVDGLWDAHLVAQPQVLALPKN
jgi:hypothetical protein